jgi:hypothetical protein
VLFLALGEDAPAERIGQAEVRFVPYQKDPHLVARYYQAADVYVHAARRRGVGSYDYRGSCLRDSSGRNSGGRDR